MNCTKHVYRSITDRTENRHSTHTNHWIKEILDVLGQERENHTLWRQICLICKAYDDEHDEHTGTALILHEWNKNMVRQQNDTDREETTVLGHSATLSTTNPTRTPQGLIPGICGEKLVTDCLIY